MNIVTLEAQPELELNDAVRAYRPRGELLYASFDAAALDGLVETATTANARAIVVNLPDVRFISAHAMGDLMALERRLGQSWCMLVLLVENVSLRELLLGAGLNRRCVIAASRGELIERLQLITNPPDEGLTEEALAEARTANVSIEDILREANL